MLLSLLLLLHFEEYGVWCVLLLAAVDDVDVVVAAFSLFRSFLVFVFTFMPVILNKRHSKNPYTLCFARLNFAFVNCTMA